MNIQFTNSQVKEKQPKVPHWFLNQRENFLVCATTRYRGSFCLQAWLDPAFCSLRFTILLQFPLCPLPTCLPWRPKVSLVGWYHHSTGRKWSSNGQAWATCPPLESKVKSTLSQWQWPREKERCNFPEWHHTKYQEKENGCWVTKSVHVLDSGIDF